MEIYHYHPETGELIAIGQADESPMETGAFLIPSYATAVRPPEFSTNQVPVFDGLAWHLVADHRGQTYYLPDGSRHKITAIGVAPPPDTLASPPLPTIEQIRSQMKCEAWQLRRALTQIGLRSAVEAVVAAADQDTKDMWDYAVTYRRNHPIVAALAASLNKTDADIDALFDLASTFTE